jgi:hypothetical protein
MVVGVCGAASAFEACICFVVIGPAVCSWFVCGRSFHYLVGAVVSSILSVAVVLPTLRPCRLHLCAG